MGMRRLLPVAVALLLVLAGCSGLGTQDTTTTAPDPTGNATATDAPGTADGANASAVKADTLAALDDVETYRVSTNQTSRLSGNVQQTVVTTTTGVFDRTAREARLNQSQDAGVQSVTSQLYLVDETLYQRSPQFARQYDSNWVAIDLSENFSAAWDGFDTLSRQQALLNASSVTLDGTTTVDGQQAYVLRLRPDAERYEELGSNTTGQTLDVSNVSATYYVSTETDRLVASTTRLNATQTVSGRSLTIDQTIELRFDEYGQPVTVRLPDEARETAVPIGNLSGGGA